MIVIDVDTLGRILGFVLGCFITTAMSYLSFRMITDREFRPGYDGFFTACIVLAFLIGLVVVGIFTILWSVGLIVIE